MSRPARGWRGQRSEPAASVGGYLRERRTGSLEGDTASRSRLRVAVEAFYWLAIIGLALYAIFAPVLPEGGPL